LAFPVFSYYIFMCIAITNFSFHFSRFNFWLLIFSVLTCAWIFVTQFLAAHFLSSYMFLKFLIQFFDYSVIIFVNQFSATHLLAFSVLEFNCWMLIFSNFRNSI
jgi:hypothetical protein